MRNRGNRIAQLNVLHNSSLRPGGRGGSLASRMRSSRANRVDLAGGRMSPSNGVDDKSEARMKLSVVIPVYNEVGNINEIIKRVQTQKLASEIIVVHERMDWRRIERRRRSISR